MSLWPAALALLIAAAPAPSGDGDGVGVGVSVRVDPCLTPDGTTPTADDRLAALCALRAREDTAVEVSPERLKKILDRPEFSGTRDRPSDALARLMQKLKALWESLLERREAAVFSEWTRVGILCLAVAVVLGAALRIRQRRGAGLRPSTRRAETASGPIVLDDPEVHLSRARRAVGAGGDPREAIRQALLALLSVLERRRWARPDRVRTNRELASELPSRGAPAEVAREVDRLVDWYDRTYYSLEPVSPDEAEHFLDDVAAFERRLAAGGPT